MRHVLFAFASLGMVGCSNAVGSDDDARVAYMGLDASIDKAIALGLQGYNSAKSANIPPQSVAGSKSGTLTVSGKVDQGSSDNKTMNLLAAMDAYSDGADITYATPGATLDMSLKKIPTGTLSGSLDGDYEMIGDLEGQLHLSLTFNGDLQPNAADPTQVERKPGTTHVTGTASSGDSSYAVDVTR
jgi:hypothetical protein